jgi:hypothetical protein
MAVFRKNTGKRMFDGSRGLAPEAIFMVQPAQNRRRDHLRMFGKAMTGGHELIRVGTRQREADQREDIGQKTVARGSQERRRRGIVPVCVR